MPRTPADRCSAHGGERPIVPSRATALTPLLLAYTDAAKMWGYALGVADRLTGRIRPPQP